MPRRSNFCVRVRLVLQWWASLPFSQETNNTCTLVNQGRVHGTYRRRAGRSVAPIILWLHRHPSRFTFMALCRQHWSHRTFQRGSQPYPNETHRPTLSFHSTPHRGGNVPAYMAVNSQEHCGYLHKNPASSNFRCSLQRSLT
jgi:hypothetical protein